MKVEWIKFGLIVLLLVLGCVATNEVVTQNAFNNVYPIEADSISIPILTTFLLSIVFSPLVMLFSFTCIYKNETNGRFSKLKYATKVFGYLFSYFVISLLVLMAAIYWNTPHHYTISYVYMGLVGLIQAMFLYDLSVLAIKFIKKRKQKVT
jgi:hypothetical protein